MISRISEAVEIAVLNREGIIFRFQGPGIEGGNEPKPLPYEASVAS